MSGSNGMGTGAHETIRPYLSSSPPDDMIINVGMTSNLTTADSLNWSTINNKTMSPGSNNEFSRVSILQSNSF